VPVTPGQAETERHRAGENGPVPAAQRLGGIAVFPAPLPAILAAAAPVGWSIPSLIAPRGGTGTIGGIMNFLNNMMGVVAPVTTGYVVGATKSFTDAFLIAGVVLIVGIAAYLVLLGNLVPIPDPPANGAVTSAPAQGA